MIEAIVETGLSIARRADDLAVRIRRLISNGNFDDTDIIELIREVDRLTDVSMLVDQTIRALGRRHDLQPEIYRHLPVNVSLH